MDPPDDPGGTVPEVALHVIISNNEDSMDTDCSVNISDNSHDSAPFTVHIQKVLSSPDDNSSLHPIAFGRFLQRNTFKNVIDGSLLYVLFRRHG